MVQKAVAGLFILAMIAALVVGGIKLFQQDGQEHEAQVNGQHINVPRVESAPAQPAPGNQGRGYGQGAGRQPNVDVGGQTLTGVVRETVELVIETTDGEMVQVGLGPSSYREAQGFSLNLGDQVRVTGYWEGDEFKATGIENLTTGAQIMLRDALGRPMWAGQGRQKNSGF